MRFAPINYRIDGQTVSGERKSIEVSGFAVDCDCPVRFCVRKVGPNYWKADHYDSGLSIDPPDFWNVNTGKLILAKATAQHLKEQIANGKYADAINRLNEDAA